MIATRNFVLLNIPKTGSTFARSMIKRIENDNFIQRSHILPNKIKGRYQKRRFREIYCEPNYPMWGETESDQHGGYCQIPRRYLNRDVLAIIRNPFDRYISIYNFGWWKKVPQDYLPLVGRYYPEFPDLDFSNFMKFYRWYVNLRVSGIDSIANPDAVEVIGANTIVLIDKLCVSPCDLFNKLFASHKYNIKLEEHIPPSLVLFDQATLNDSLARYFETIGYSATKVKLVREHGRILPTNSENVNCVANKEVLYSYSEIDAIRIFDKFSFSLAERFGFDHTYQNYMLGRVNDEEEL